MAADRTELTRRAAKLVARIMGCDCNPAVWTNSIIGNGKRTARFIHRGACPIVSRDFEWVEP